MQRLLFLCFIFLASLSLLGQEERIYTFHADVHVDTSGVVSVRERIRVYADGDVFKRGITRALPLTRSDVDGNRIKIAYNIKGVDLHGAPVNFFTEKESGDLVIYVGESDVFLDPGFYTYVIEYETGGQVGFFDDYDELSWNVNGVSSSVIDTVSAFIHLPAEAEILSHRCYSGVYGSTESNCTSMVVEDGALYVEAVNLRSKELLTASVGFTKGIVSQPVEAGYQTPQPVTFFDKNGLPIVSAIILLLLLFYYFATWRKYGIDPPKPVAIPQFSPPEGFSPASVGMLHKEQYNNDFVTASLVNLAVKGFIRINETEERGGVFGMRKDRNYVLVKQKDADASLPEEEKVIMRELFRYNTALTLTGEYNEDVANMMSSFRSELKSQYSPILREGMNLVFHILPWVLMIVYGLFLLYFAVFEPTEQIVTFIIRAFITFFILLVLSITLRKTFVRSKFKWFGYVFAASLIIGAIAILFSYPSRELSVNAIGFVVFFPLMIISYLAYAYLIKRPGERKLHFKSLIEGLKMYIDTAEEKRLQFFNPPEVTPHVFEALLPYAIALDMEKVWGAKFEKSFLAAMTVPEPYQPPWYTGTVLRPANFGHTLNSTLSNTVNHSAVKPADLSSGGGNWGSGSFGGGFSGGGGGGGSVGGW